MEIIHIAAECYPVAKVGGLADVLGALPKYQNQQGQIAKVVMPKYRTKFLDNHQWELVHESGTYLGTQWFRYSVIKEKNNTLNFDLYLVDISGLLDRENVYGYNDDPERFLAFQIAAVHWIKQWNHQPDIVHCHDHHTALIPFMLQYCHGLESLRKIATVLTIHNAQYQGWMDWKMSHLIPAYDSYKSGLLDWNHTINPLASGVRCAYKVTTVSPGYLEELRHSANGLEKLFEYEYGKCVGILNGIDYNVWNPATDKYLEYHYTIKKVNQGKASNKKWLCTQFDLEEDKPLIIFIGRLVGEKAADLLSQCIAETIDQSSGNINFLVLGSGDPNVEKQLKNLSALHKGKFNSYIGYNEELAHRMYAGADFLLMPSRIEPCGLNQMYALHYGTIPIVRKTGGLKDTVIDIAEADKGGFGLCLDNASVWDINHALSRAVGWFYNDHEILKTVRKKIMQIDHSWDNSAKKYIELYNSLI